ncbi:transposase [Streptomyces montanus]|uniref:Transposase n=1 Tax=Streptomyces montanus TaxID=2580423 RepID=A0A5R9FPK0_9ACTN|nr:transposase [Streptomyces montanus]
MCAPTGAEALLDELPASALDARFTAFAEMLFGHLRRADQRRWAHIYLRGLLMTPGKKSIPRLAASISSSATAHQSLHQFVNASPWDWSPARRELTRLAERFVRPKAWTLATAVQPKRGDRTCGVHRRFVPAMGRTVNCQVGVGMFLASESEHIPVDWHLLLPDQWDGDPELRERARIPEAARNQPLWSHALSLSRTLAAHTGLPPVPFLADMDGYPGAAPLIDGLSRSRQDFVIAVSGDLPMLPAVPSPVNTAREVGRPIGARRFLDLHSARRGHAVVAGAGGGRRPVRVLSSLVNLEPGRGARAGTHRPYRLFTVLRPDGAPGPVWITSLVDRSMDELFSLTRLLSGTTTAMTDMENYGVLDFEGRSFPGWHHHMTLVSAAYAYSRLIDPVAVPQVA